MKMRLSAKKEKAYENDTGNYHGNHHRHFASVRNRLHRLNDLGRHGLRLEAVMSKKNETCGTCWQYSNTLGKCMITQCSERPDTECEIGMYITKPEPAETWKKDAREEVSEDAGNHGET